MNAGIEVLEAELDRLDREIEELRGRRAEIVTARNRLVRVSEEPPFPGPQPRPIKDTPQA